MKLSIALPFVAFALPALAGPNGILRYDCDLDGVIGELTAEYEIIDASGEAYSPDGDMAGTVGAGSSTVFYQGELSSPANRYVFTGENQFAEFTDLATHKRFIVHMETDGDALRLTANPNDGAPTHYHCLSRD